MKYGLVLDDEDVEEILTEYFDVNKDDVIRTDNNFIVIQKQGKNEKKDAECETVEKVSVINEI